MDLVERLRDQLNEEPGLLNFLYPYARFFTPVSEDSIITEWNSLLTEPIEGLLYLSIPFCERKCNFCDFGTSFGKPAKEIEEYVNGVISEMGIISQKLNLANFKPKAVYIGGGTPNLLSPGQTEKLLTELHKRFNLDKTEITFELYARPDLVLPLLKVLYKHGVTRVSLAAQDLDDKIIADTGRNHTALDVLKCYDAVRSTGITIINLDLMVGIMGQTAQTWQKTMEQIVQLQPDQVSLNPFSNRHPGIIWYKKKITGELPSLSETKTMYFAAQERLLDLGYRQTTRVNFERGYEYKYEGGIINLTPRLGLGMNSLCLTPNYSYRNTDQFAQYYQLLTAGKLPVQDSYPITGSDQVHRWMFFKSLGLKFDDREFQGEFGKTISSTFPDQISALAEIGLIQIGPDLINCTKEGIYYSTLLQRAFYNPELIRDKERAYSGKLHIVR